MNMEIHVSNNINNKNCNNDSVNEQNQNNTSKEIREYNNTKTPLQEFYSNQCIFMTGSTGFLGKILIEKLLRCCPDISRIYILVRPKKEKNIKERVEELLKDSIFDLLKKTNPEFYKKIFAIPGDCSMTDIGLCMADKKLLIDEVSIVFHLAATVRFDEKLTDAVPINLQSTNCILNMCKHMPKLKAFVHVSTAYANCIYKRIEEKFYDYSVNYEDFLNSHESLKERCINESTSQLINPWPNTYTFTKALSEDLIRKKNKNLPISIFRPGIVISTAKEPKSGWLDNYYGPTGIIAGAMIGFLQAMHCDTDLIANLVPVDLTVNALITSAWHTATHLEKRDSDMLIYNFSSTTEAPISWGSFQDHCKKNISKYPTEKAKWNSIFVANKKKIIYWLYILFLHWIPALILDFFAITTGGKPRMIKLYQKTHKLADVISHFSTNEWIFTNSNVQSMWDELNSRDKEMFNFSMKNFDWGTYFDEYVKGIRIYLLKDDMKTLESSRKSQKRLYWKQQILKFCLLSYGCWYVWSNWIVKLY